MKKINEKALQTLCDAAIDAATKAGKVIELHAGKVLEIHGKDGGTSIASQIFTEVDVMAEKIILDRLVPTIEAFDLGLLAEETEHGTSRLDKEYFWCIDPIDGTLPFTENVPGYSVSIALVSQAGIPYIGVVYDPVTHTLYHAVRNNGAFRNGKKWTTTPSSDTFTFVCDRSFLKTTHYNHTREIIAAYAHENGYKDIKAMTQGGAAMNACWVLEHAPACYLKYPKPQQGGGSIWDYAATACIFNEIGAHVSDSSGKQLTLNNPHSTFMNESGILYASNSTMAEHIINNRPE